MDEPRMIEGACVPVFYVDGRCKIEVEGVNARITFFEYRRVCGERVRVPVVEIVRPIASINGQLPTEVRQALSEGGVVH